METQALERRGTRREAAEQRQDQGTRTVSLPWAFWLWSYGGMLVGLLGGYWRGIWLHNHNKNKKLKVHGQEKPRKLEKVKAKVLPFRTREARRREEEENGEEKEKKTPHTAF